MPELLDKIKCLKKMNDMEFDRFYDMVRKNARCIITGKDTEHGDVEIYERNVELGTIRVLFMLGSGSIAFQVRVVTDMDELAYLGLHRKRADTLRTIIRENNRELDTNVIDRMNRDEMIELIAGNRETMMSVARNEFCKIFDRDAVERGDVIPIDQDEEHSHDWVRLLWEQMDEVYIRDEHDDVDNMKYYTE